MLRFHLDESVTLAIVAGLRQRGIDVTTPQNAQLLGAPDEEHLEHARHEDRVLITHDVDYLVLHGQLGIRHSGIAYCHQRKYSVGELLRSLQLLDACYEAHEMTGRVEFL
jgi:predicted nuclease of predicted toxin-antitoxin system